MCNNLYGKRDWKWKDISIFTTDLLCCTPETHVLSQIYSNKIYFLKNLNHLHLHKHARENFFSLWKQQMFCQLSQFHLRTKSVFLHWFERPLLSYTNFHIFLSSVPYICIYTCTYICTHIYMCVYEYTFDLYLHMFLYI